MAVSAINVSIEGLPNSVPIVAETNSTQDNSALMDSFQSLTNSYQQAAEMCSKYKAEVTKNLPILKQRHEKQSAHLKQLEAQVVQLRLEVLSSYSRYDQSKIEFDLCKKLQRHIARELSVCDASHHPQSAEPIQSLSSRYSPTNASQRHAPPSALPASDHATPVPPLEACLHRLLSMAQYRPPVTQPTGDRGQSKRHSLESLFDHAKSSDNHSVSSPSFSRSSAKTRPAKPTRAARDEDSHAFIAGNIDDIDEEEADQIDPQSDGETEESHPHRRARSAHANGNQSSDSGSDTEALIYHEESNESTVESVRSSRVPSSALPSQLETIYEGWVESQASQMFRVLLRQVRDEVLPSALSRSSKAAADSSHPSPLRYLYSRFHDEVYSRLWSDMIQARCHKVRVMQRLSQLLAEREQMFSKCDKLGKVVVCLELCLQPIELRDPAIVESTASMLTTLSEMYSSTTMAPSPAQAPLPPSIVPADSSLVSALPTIHESLSPRALSDSQQQQQQQPVTNTGSLLSLLSQPAPSQPQSDAKPDQQAPVSTVAMDTPQTQPAAKSEARSKSSEVSGSSPSLSSALHSGVFAGVWEEIRIAYSLICKLEQARSLRDSYFLQLEALLGDSDSQSKPSAL